MGERLAGRRKDPDAGRRDHMQQVEEATGATAGADLWAVDAPATIETPSETKPEERRGDVLGPG